MSDDNEPLSHDWIYSVFKIDRVMMKWNDDFVFFIGMEEIKTRPLRTRGDLRMLADLFGIELKENAS